MPKQFPPREAYTFDDVLLVPGASEILPEDVCLKTVITKGIELNVPLMSSANSRVTESAMAIAMAKVGGMGIIHGQMPIGRQVEEVRRVKRYEARIVKNPITIDPNSPLAEALDLMASYGVSGIPVVEQGKVVGILTSRDVRFVEDVNVPVKELMTKDNLVMAQGDVSEEMAKELLHQNRVEKLILTDDQGQCKGLITAKDIEKSIFFPSACRDESGRLRVAGAVGVGKDAYDRASALADAELDMVVVNAAHGHSKDVLGTVSKIRQLRSSQIPVMAGNVATAEAARALINEGADAIKIGVNMGARNLSGVGVPQLTAIIDVADECDRLGIPVVADVGVQSASDVSKAIAAGANCIALDQLLTGTDEAPGELSFYKGRAYKAPQEGGGTSRRQRDVIMDPHSLSQEGMDDKHLYKGRVEHVTSQLVKGLRAAMGYTGNKDMESMRRNAEFIKLKKS